MLQLKTENSLLLQNATLLLQIMLKCYIALFAENQEFIKLLHNATNVTPTFSFRKAVF